MPPRYQQGQLASSVVGTPGVDQSAGVVAGEIAKASEHAQESDAAMRLRSLQGAEQDFNRASGYFFHIQQQQRAIERAEQAAILQSQLEGTETKAQVNLGLLESQLQKEFANEPGSALEAAKQRGRGLIDSLMPMTDDKRIAARFNIVGEREYQQFLGRVSSWQTGQQAKLENVDFDRDLAAFGEASISEGSTGDYSKVVRLYESLESPAMRSRAYKLGPEAENARQKASRSVLLNGMEALGRAEPKRALEISQTLMNLGLVKPKDVEAIEGNLRSHDEYLHTLAERQRTENIRSVKTEFNTQFGGDMIQAINSRNLEDADRIVRDATAYRLKLERDGAAPEIINEAQTQVESLQKDRNEARMMSLEETRNRQMQLGLAAQERGNLIAMQALEQANPQAIALRAAAFSAADMARRAIPSKTLSFEQKRKAIDDYEQALEAAKGVIDRAYSGAPVEAKLRAEANDFNALLKQSIDKQIEAAKSPIAGASRAAQDIFASITGNESFLVNSEFLKPPSDQLVAAYRVRNPKLSVSTIQATVANEFLRELEKQRTPDVKFTQQDLADVRQTVMRRMLKELQGGK